MATPQLGSYGTKINLKVRQGGTFEHYLTLTGPAPDLDPVDLTGSTFRAQIRKKALDAVVVTAITCTVDRAVGTPTLPARVLLVMTDETTAGIPAGEVPTSADSKYVWDLEWEDSTGRVIPVAYGDVEVLREVTRA